MSGAVCGAPAAVRADGAALSAVLEGDPALVSRVAGDLARRGVTVVGAGGDGLRVNLRPTAEGILLALDDARGGESERVVSTIDTAGALIESWLRPEIADPLLAPRGTPPRPAPPPPALALSAAPAPAPTPSSRWMPVLRLGGASVAGSMALDASAASCARVGPLCVGPELRFTRQVDHAAEGDLRLRRLPLSPSRARFDWQGLLLAELPVPLGRPGRPLLVLGLGAGLGGPGGAARSEARAELVVPVHGGLALDAGVAATSGGNQEDGRARVGFGLRWGWP